VTKNKRYEAYYDALNDKKIADAIPAPVTLPVAAYGPQPIEWAAQGERVAVWAWVQWKDRPAERIPAVATGWNDRVVIVQWYSEGGVRDTVVWRNAVTRRKAPSPP
jgi:hypothetical protein